MTAKTGHKPDQERRVQPQQERREQHQPFRPLRRHRHRLGRCGRCAYCNPGNAAANAKPAPVTERRFDLRFIEAAV